jgi:hypothetical protein
VATTLNNLGTVQGDLNALEAARASYEEALEIRRELARARPEVYRPDVATTLNNLGTVQRALNALEAARASYEEARDLYVADAERNPFAHLVDRMRAWTNLGRLYQRESSTLGWPDYPKARQAFRKARETFEQFRARFADPAQRKRVQSEAAHIYERLVQTCIDLWDVEGGLQHLCEAVEVAEASRSRHLIDLLADEALQPKFAPAHLVDAFRHLRRRLRQIERQFMEEAPDRTSGPFGSEPGLRRASAGVKMARLTMEVPEALTPAAPSRRDHPGNAQPAKLLAERDELNRQHAVLLAQIKEHDPEFDPDQPVPPVSFQTVQEQLLPDDVPTAIVQFTLTRERGLALVILPDTVLRVRLPELNERAGWDLAIRWLEKYYNDTRERDPRAWMKEWADVLPALLEPVARQALHPVLAELQGRGIRRLIIAPHRALHLFPLHACPLAVRGATASWSAAVL